MENQQQQQDNQSLLKDEIIMMRQEIRELIRLVKELQNTQQKNGDKMNDHIDFVEKVYSTVRHPLDFFKKKIEYVMGRSSQTVNSIEDESLPQLVEHKRD